jgi:hypothetical protein
VTSRSAASPRWTKVRLSRLSSSFYLMTLPVAALVMGAVIHCYVVRGSYEWFGLLRILRDVSHRAGFWVMCLGIWLVGLHHARPGYSVFALPWRRRAIWAAASLAMAGLSRSAPQLIGAGSLADELAYSLVIPGLALHLFSTPGTLRQQAAAALLTLRLAVLTFAAWTAIAFGHTMFKGMLFSVSNPVDSVLMRIDCWILGSRFYDALASWRSAGHPALTHLLDIVYVELYEQQWWSFLFFFGARDFRNARAYVLSILLIYFLGPACYFIAPSLGPVFYRPELFSDLARLAPDSAFLARFLSEQTQMTLASEAHPIAPFGFISAFPSLHVGLALIVLLAMRRSLILTLFNCFGVAFTFVATVVLGWHYMVDGVAGAVLGLLCWWFANRVVAREHRSTHSG